MPLLVRKNRLTLRDAASFSGLGPAIGRGCADHAGPVAAPPAVGQGGQSSSWSRPLLAAARSWRQLGTVPSPRAGEGWRVVIGGFRDASGWRRSTSEPAPPFSCAREPMPSPFSPPPPESRPASSRAPAAAAGVDERKVLPAAPVFFHPPLPKNPRKVTYPAFSRCV